MPDTHDVANFDLSGRTALVTGSSTGLGKAMAYAMGRAGARIAINYANNSERAEATLGEFRSDGIECELFPADITDESEVDQLCDSIGSKLGPIDILVLNAAANQYLSPIEEYDWHFHQLMLDFFVRSPYLLARRILPHMKQQGWGRIISIGSEVFYQGRSHFSAYVAAKGAQNGWSRSMARELAPDGITVNMLSPGWIPVERHADASDEARQGYADTVPVGRIGVPADMGGAAVFLASESASFINGQNIHVDGGRSVH